MKYLIFFTFALMPTFFLYGQSPNPQYNKVLADSLGADDYGMKSYVLVILKTGKVDIQDKEQRAALFNGHIANIQRLAKEGKLYVAGPFGKNELTYRGLFILNVKTIEEAQTLCDTDPAVKAGVFDVVLLPWYGSAALGEYLKVSEQINKFKM
jgi:uncharacterized protein YciI